ncbi:MAG: hypothetical protein K2M91_09865 [Lachnospiraceae bacterium]|nr:hypothetical protein [Lachnospiraceae bacterium]
MRALIGCMSCPAPFTRYKKTPELETLERESDKVFVLDMSQYESRMQ